MYLGSVPGILSDANIAACVRQGVIKIDPWDDAQLNPTSYDLTLGDEVAVYKSWVSYDERWEEFQKMGVKGARDGADFHPLNGVYDVHKEPEVVSFKMDAQRGWLLKPGIGYLMHTREQVWTKSFVPIVDGKSSIGRLFIQVHITAGFGDPGFDGQYTLEVVATHPVRVYPGMRIAQIRFHTIEGSLDKPYEGNYRDDAAKGAVPSKAWKQFK